MIEIHKTKEPMENFNEYQDWAATKEIFDKDVAIAYLVTGLAGEAGEVAQVYAKWIRDGGKLDKTKMIDELGDCLWMVARLADHLGFCLSEVAAYNQEKLEARYGFNLMEHLDMNDVDTSDR